ncbi:MAG: replication restart helicase PriA [Alphaproteobacteria bacterium]
MNKIVKVFLPFAGRPFYSYRLEEGMRGEKGTLVGVSFRYKKLLGLLMDEDENPACEISKIKPISRETDFVFSKDFLDFLKTVSGYTLSDFGAVLKATFPPSNFFSETEKIVYSPAGDFEGKITPKRQKILQSFLSSEETLSIDNLIKRTAFSRSMIQNFIRAGGLIPIKNNVEEEVKNIPYILSEFDHLYPSQKQAVEEIESSDSGSPILLNGITGSGKTEVYFTQVKRALDRGKQVLILLPEISLTSQFLDRFEKRFGRFPSLWHSGVSLSEKRTVWKKIISGKESVLIGTRSSLFLPFKNLGLIVVDEEHDGSYKQEEQFIYHARDMAVLRAQKENAQIILASATPSFESLANVEEGRYREVKLSERVKKAVLPEIELVDLKIHSPEKIDLKKGWISPVLVKALEETFERKQQAFLFLNRRGYAPLMICQKCGYRAKCPNCDVHLVYHQGKKYDSLVCHHCGYTGIPPKKCVQCEEEESFVLCGPGIERLAEEAKKRFPNQRLLVLSSETTQSAKQLEKALKKIENKEVDCVVGTQILAKGHHFPGLTLVGIVDADMSLMGADFRASEKTLQLLEQTSGRAGRESEKGFVYVQTYAPDHPVMLALKNNEKTEFIKTELAGRKVVKMPPFGSLIAIILLSKNEQFLNAFCKDISRQAPQHTGVSLFGPADAPIRFLRGRYRKRFLVHGPRGLACHKFVKAWLNQVSISSSIQIKIDVNPYSFF